MDAIRLQHTIRKNAEEMQDYVADLQKWESEITKKDSQLATKGSERKSSVNQAPIRGSGGVPQQIFASGPSEREQAALKLKDEVFCLFSSLLS